MAVHSTEGRDQIGPDAGVPTPARLEEALRLAVSDRVGATRFALWFGGNVRLGLNREGDSLIVRVPDAFFRDWIERHYTPSLLDAVQAVIGQRLRVSVEVDGKCDQHPADVAAPPSSPPAGSENPRLLAQIPLPMAAPPGYPAPLIAASNGRAAVPNPPLDRSEIHQTRRGEAGGSPAGVILPGLSRRPLCRLEDFVTGPGNRMAHAAAAEMSRTAGQTFNPLMIHSAIGLGKSHLLEGINLGLRQLHPKLQIVQMAPRRLPTDFSSRCAPEP